MRHPLHMFAADYKSDLGIGGDRPQIVIEDLEPDLAQSHTVEGFFRHEPGRFGAITASPNIFLTNDDAKERRNSIPFPHSVCECRSADEALALPLMDSEAGASCRRGQNECIEIATRLRWGKRLETVSQQDATLPVLVVQVALQVRCPKFETAP